MAVFEVSLDTLRVRKLYVPIVVLALTLPLSSQSPSANANSVLQQSALAFSSAGAMGSLKLKGTAHVYIGRQEETGTAEMIVGADGSTSITMKLEKGTRKETRAGSFGSQACSWTDSAGVEHSMQANCWTSVPWLLPSMALTSTQSLGQLSITDGGSQNFNGRSAHLVNTAIASAPANVPESGRNEAIRLSKAALYIDDETHLPIGLRYSMLPSGGIVRPISVEIRYLSYQSFSGMNIPTRIERRINGALQLSIDVSQVSRGTE